MEYEYDFADRMTKKTLDHSDQSGFRSDDVIQYFYDGALPATDTIPGMTASQVTTNGVAGFGAAKGQLTAVIYGISGGKEFHSWNALGEETQAIRCVDGTCETTKFAYDAGHRISQLTYPDNEVVTHVYDGHGNLKQLAGAASYINTMQWNARGQVEAVSYGNGVTVDPTYSTERGWLDEVSVRGPKPAPNTLLYRAAYAYRADAQVKNVRSSTNARLNMRFAYDNLTRLTTISPWNYAGAGGLAHPDTTTQTYAYDAIGNITQNSAYFGSSSYDYDDKGHLLTGVGGLRVSQRAGAITTIWGSQSGCALAEPRVFVWDAEQRLVRASHAGQTVNFEYDATGQRIRKASQGSVTQFFGTHSEIETKNGTPTRTQFVYAGPMLVAKKTQTLGATPGTPETVWFHADHLTSTRLMTDATGAKVAHYDYAIFGEKTHESGTKAAANQKGFTSHEHEDELGLIYMKARYYDPVLGRFISPDSIIPEPGNPQAWNRYAYVFNNPFNNTDPTGHDTYRQNRELQALNMDKKSEPVKHGLSHTFDVTTKPDGSLEHTYSWGNTYDKNGNGEWHIDRKEDQQAAEIAIEQQKEYDAAPAWKKPFMPNKMGKRIGGEELDAQVEKEFQERENDPNHPSRQHGWKPQDNCKHEADKLLKDAKSRSNTETSKDNSSASPSEGAKSESPSDKTEKKD